MDFVKCLIEMALKSNGFFLFILKSKENQCEKNNKQRCDLCFLFSNSFLIDFGEN